MLAEVWAVRYGLNLARELGIHYLIVKLDAMEIVLALNNVSCPNILICGIVHDCRNLVHAFHRCEMKHSYRETNKCSNALVKRGFSLFSDVMLFEDPLLMYLFILFYQSLITLSLSQVVL